MNMRKVGGFQFVTGFVLGAIVFGGSVAVAVSVLAQPKTAAVVIDGKTVDLKGYVIDGAHYFQLRDLDENLIPGGKDFSVVWDGHGNCVIIDTSRRYDPNEQYSSPASSLNLSPGGNNPTDGETKSPSTADNSTVADGSGKVSSVELADKTIGGNELSREDFSRQANPDIFSGIYTRGVYNAIRQTIVDRDIILPGNNEKGFNPYYAYANYIDRDFVPGENEVDTTNAIVRSVLPAHMSSYYVLTDGAEPYAKDLYKYDGYGIVKIYMNDFLAPANRAADSLIHEIETLSDGEKIVKLADALCDKLTYGKTIGANGPNEIFTSSVPLMGMCGSYANTFLYLCQRANIPCIIRSDADHAWNVVYVDGRWQIADITNYDTSRSMTWLLTQSYPKQDKKPDEAMFLQEVLVPGSTR